MMFSSLKTGDFVVRGKSIAVGVEYTWHLQNLCIAERLLHALADSMLVVPALR